MPLYKQLNNKLIPIKQKKTSLEKTMQSLVENNLFDIFGLRFITTEFSLNRFRIDTLAFDEETKSFVIIEYKRDRSFSVVDQGYAYLALLLNNKADFILEYNEKNETSLRRDEVEWSQSRVIFVAESFTRYQQEAMGFQDLPIELWEFKQHEENLVQINQLHASEKNESIKTIAKGEDAEVVSREIKQYAVNDHFKSHWVKSIALFELLSSRILDLDSRFEVRPVKHYIGFHIEGKNVVVVKARQSKLLLELLRTRPEDLNDPEQRTRYVGGSLKHWNQHITQFDIETEEDLDYAMILIKQVYKKFTA